MGELGGLPEYEATINTQVLTVRMNRSGSTCSVQSTWVPFRVYFMQFFFPERSERSVRT